MPKLKSPLIDAQAAPTVGARVRRLREARGYAITDLAAKAGVHRNTLQRLEQGRPVTPRVLERVCNSLDTIPPNLLLADEDDPQPYRIHRNSDADWVLTFNTALSPGIVPDFAPVAEAQERHRLGSVGFASGFFNAHASALRGGQIHAGTLELYGPQERPDCHHAGEEFVLCLRGRIVLELVGERIELGEGDSITFKSELSHRYHPAQPVGSAEVPPRLLMVWIEGASPSPGVASRPGR